MTTPPTMESIDTWIRIRAERWRIPGMDAEDVEQEARLVMIRALPQWDASRGALSTYVARVIDTKMANRLRDATRTFRYDPNQLSLDVPLGGEDTTLGDIVAIRAPTPHDLAETRDHLNRIVATVRTLSPSERLGLAAALNGGAGGMGASRARQKLRNLEAA